MKPRVLAILAAATAGTLLVGFLATRDGRSDDVSTRRSAGDSEYLFPQLRAAADSIAELRVSQGAKSVHLVREAGTNNWHVATLGDYPANPDRVRDTVRSMIDAKILERKTARKESHAAIGLEDPANTDARSVLLEAFDAQAKPLARLVLGDVAPGAAPSLDPTSSARFVRRADEDQSYLVNGRFPADPSSTAWVVRSIAEIPGSRVREIRVTHPDGDAVVASRENESGELTLRDIPVGRSVKDQTQVARLAQALAFLTLESVKPAAEASSLGDFSAATTFDLITFDHLLVRTRVVKHADEYWATIEALPEPLPKHSITEVDQGSVGAPTANGEVSIDDPSPPPAATTHDDPTGATREAARNEAASLNAKLGPWVFRLTAAKGEQLTTRLDEVLTPAAVQGPELPKGETPEPPPIAPAPIPSVAPPTPEPEVDPAKKLFPDSRP